MKVPSSLDSQGLVDDPEASGQENSSQFKTSNAPNMPQAPNLPTNDTLKAQQLRRPLTRGGKKTKRRDNKRRNVSRRYK